MFDLTVLLYIGLGAGALITAFVEYAISYRKRMKTEAL
jgi:hypothetical protein